MRHQGIEEQFIGLPPQVSPFFELSLTQKNTLRKSQKKGGIKKKAEKFL